MSQVRKITWEVVLIYLVLILGSSMALISPPPPVPEDMEAAYIRTLTKFNTSITEKEVEIYIASILKYAKKYNLDSARIARQLFIESLFTSRARGSAGELGAAQLKRFHDGVIRSTEYFSASRSMEENYFDPRVSIEALCILIADYKARHGNYELAILAYWKGENSSYFRDSREDFRRTGYYQGIFSAEYLSKYIERTSK